ncbi:NUDIX hydrolase [Streptomyces calidiresistens]|uniref:NUDIX domain-containing protein n=1 Tax=Streptomyces calidiresistens TaxID=1485586 RepID=A0A7W3T6S9_9ACTN|nr:NUDIX hydrolase [Streptomyces calidiresistens]MBB0231964.1 NUDIX domain-containing protein [Streptomyces calidiresistens]
MREDAVRVLGAWPAPDGEQEALRLAYLEHLGTHPDAMRRACAAGHLTAGALVVNPTGDRVLLTLHRKLRMWLQTGGHCEPGDTGLAAAALREATEESGIPDLRLLPDPVRLDRHRTPCAPHLDVQYLAVAPPDAPAVCGEESLDVRWFHHTEVAGVADASVVALMEAGRRRLAGGVARGPHREAGGPSALRRRGR